MKSIQSSSNYDNLKELQFFNETLKITSETEDSKTYYTRTYYTSLGKSSVYFVVLKHREIIGSYICLTKIGYTQLNVKDNDFDPIKIYKIIRAKLDTSYTTFDLIKYEKELKYFLQYYKDQYERYLIFA